MKLMQLGLDFTYDLTWCCPEDDCSYEVNFVHPPEHLREWMDPSDYRVLSRGVWDRDDLVFKKIFMDIFEQHFYEHLKSEGIQRLAKRRHEDDYVSGRHRLETVKLSGPGQATNELFDVSTTSDEPHGIRSNPLFSTTLHGSRTVQNTCRPLKFPETTFNLLTFL